MIWNGGRPTGATPDGVCRAVEHDGEVLEVFATKRRDRRAALNFLYRTMKRYGRRRSILTDRLRSYRSAMKTIGNAIVPHDLLN